MVETDKVVFLHTPKTGGAAMQFYMCRQFMAVRKNYFLSFAGIDDSRYDGDDDTFAAPRPGGNQCVIERIFDEPARVDAFRHNSHFQRAKVLCGHTTCSFATLFPEYRFQYLTVLREPIERTISNIAQLSPAFPTHVAFGAHQTSAPKFSDDYWEFIFDILTRGYPVEGLMVHENLYLRNCMTRILQGSKYRDVHEEPTLNQALGNAMRIQISFFDDFNAGLQRSFDVLGIPIDMSGNLRARHGMPDVDPVKRPLGRYCNAPRKLIDFVIEHNQTDIQLYATLRAWASET